MIKKIINIFILFYLVQFTFTLGVTWKVFFIMDSSDELSDMAIKNITDMARGKPADSVEFLVQLHAYNQSALRYKVTNIGVIFLEEALLSGDSKQDFIDAASWAFSGLDAEHIMLILSNHGWGILDPIFNSVADKWQLGNNNQISDQLSSIKRSASKVHNSIKNHKNYKKHKRHKGFMFNQTSKTYLNNQDLIEGLAFIKERLLNNKKLDVIAFDTCMGATFEVAYQVAPYAQYFIGNQSRSLADGFDYQSIMPLLNKKLNPLELSKEMVKVFDNYYSQYDKSGIYTHSALDLSYAHKLKKALDIFIEKLLKLDEILPVITYAHQESPRFCMWPMYTDLIAFCKLAERQLNKLPLTNKDKVTASGIHKALYDLYSVSQSFVVARCGGHLTKGLAHGYAIYLPENIFTDEIDNSYYKTLFAKESLWIDLLKQIN